jgi:transposase
MLTLMNGGRFCEFLKRLTHNAGAPVFLIVDGHPVHRSMMAKKLVASTEGKPRLFFLPGYSPELNPDELVWSNLKHHNIGKRLITAPDQLKRLVISHMRALQKCSRTRCFSVSLESGHIGEKCGLMSGTPQVMSNYLCTY